MESGSGPSKQNAAQILAIRKRQQRVGLVLILAFLGIITVFAKGLLLDPTQIPSVQIGKPAYDFSVKQLQGQSFLEGSTDGGTLTLAQLKGRPVIINFFASWCVSCRAEGQEFEAFWRKHSKDVVVLGIAIQDSEDAARDFVKRLGKSYVIGFDESNQSSIDYGVMGVPETFLIDRQGVIRHKVVGPMTMAELEKQLPIIL